MSAKHFEVRKPYGPFGLGFIMFVDSDDPGYPDILEYAAQGYIADVTPDNGNDVTPDNGNEADPGNGNETPDNGNVANPARAKK